MSKQQRHTILRVLFVCFHDMLTYAMLTPILALLFLDSSCGLLASETQGKHFIFGLFLSVYSLMQICSLPVWARLSVSLSKKTVLKLSYLGNSLGYVVGALGVHSHQLWLLFVGAAIAGLMGANLSTMHAIISQNAPRSHWPRLYSLLGAVIGAAFIIGPQVTGFCLSHLPSHRVCLGLYLLCAGVSSINFFIIDLLPGEASEARADAPLRPRRASTPAFFSFNRELRRILLFQFCIYLGWYCFIKFFQVYLLETLHCSDVWSCYGISYLGFCCTLWQGLRYRWNTPLFSFKYTFHLALLMMAVSFAAFLFIDSVGAVMLAVFCLACSYAVIVPSSLAMLVGKGSLHAEYKTSAYQSIQAATKIIAPLTAGFVLSFTSFATALVCMLLVCCAGGIVCLNPHTFSLSSSNEM